MFDISAFQHKFRAVPINGGGAKHENGSRVQKRNRPVVSCLACRNRKSKCDRERPCNTCKGHGTTCSYKQASKATSRQTPQDRLSHLEDLVVQLMTSKHIEDQKQIPFLGKASTSPTDTSRGEDPPTEDESTIADVPRGAFNSSRDQQSYVGPTHWQAILETINGLKSELSFVEENLNGEQPDNNDFKDSLFSTPCPPNLAYVLKQLPPKNVADGLLSTYFNSRLFCVPIVHMNHFRNMYDQFWQNQTNMPILWISSLFSMLSISGLLVETLGSGKPSVGDSEVPREVYSRAAAQCLVLGNWVKPQRHLIEALFLYTQCKAISSLDPAGETWILYGVISRQAIRLGYHRDPKHFPELSVFEAEIRRRTWFLIRQFDILIAFQAGLPCNFQDDDEWDAEPPRNLLDEDFDESSTELPMSRSHKDVTGMIYFLAKGNIMDLLKKLLHQQLSSKPLSYDEDVLKLDKELQDVYHNIPDILRMRPMSQSYTDAAWLIMNRFKVEILYLKSLCIIHRKYLTSNPRHQYSIETCMHAAMQILNHQDTIYTESKPGGQLYTNRWMVMSLHLADFFLAGVILGLIITTVPYARLDLKKVMEIRSLLRNSLNIISEQRLESAEAERFSSALEIILRRMDGGHLSMDKNSVQSPDQITPADPAFLDTSPSMTETTVPSLATNEFQEFFGGTENFDWSLIDNGLVLPNVHAHNYMSWNGDTTLPNGDFDSWLNQQS